MKKRTDYIKAAARAHTDISIFYGIIALLEGGLVSSDSYAAADRIIASCKREAQKSLARYDKAAAFASQSGKTP